VILTLTSSLPLTLVGGFVAAHGSQKLFGILGGYGLEGTGQYLEASASASGSATAVTSTC
jgi:putative oxidoreductase